MHGHPIDDHPRLWQIVGALLGHK